MHPSNCMNLFDIENKDRRWLFHWLLTNLVFVTVFLCVLTFLRIGPTRPSIPIGLATASSISIDNDAGSIPPQGWRRTANGWENVSQWRVRPTQPLAELIRIQKGREPVWVQNGMQLVRDVSPLTYALLQITTIAAIVWIADRPAIRHRDRYRSAAHISAARCEHRHKSP